MIHNYERRESVFSTRFSQFEISLAEGEKKETLVENLLNTAVDSLKKNPNPTHQKKRKRKKEKGK